MPAPKKGTRPLGRLFVLSILAGMFVSLGGTAFDNGRIRIPRSGRRQPGIQKLLSGLMFPWVCS